MNLRSEFDSNLGLLLMTNLYPAIHSLVYPFIWNFLRIYFKQKKLWIPFWVMAGLSAQIFYYNIRDVFSRDQLNRRKSLTIRKILRFQRLFSIEFALWGILLYTYEKTRLKAKGSQETALANALFIVNSEKTMHLFFEPSLQQLALSSPAVISICNFYYGTMHFLITASTFIRLIVKNRDPKLNFRLSFYFMLIVALLLYYFVPTMPPRLLERYSPGLVNPPFEDTGKTTAYQKAHNEGGNPYAAIPSMHTGWATWSLLTLIDTASEKRRLLYKVGGSVHVLFTIMVIVITGNHFWMDAAAGYACVLVGRHWAERIARMGAVERFAKRLELFVNMGTTIPSERENGDDKDIESAK